MSLCRGWATVLVMLCLVGFPRASNAEFLDWIWEMSGQGMVGIMSHCKIGLGASTASGVPAWPAGETDRPTVTNPPLCYEATWFGYDLPRPLGNRDWPRAWVNIAGGVYASFRNHPDKPHNSTILMVALEPMVEVRSLGKGNFKLYHGVGGGYQRFFGDNFRSSVVDRWLFKWLYPSFPKGVST